jgi:hypothetical protein
MAVIEVDVYGPDGTTMLDTLQNAYQVKWQDVLDDVGSGSFTINAHDPKATTTNLAKGNIVKFKLDGSYRFGFIMEEPEWIVLAAEGQSAEVWLAQGRGVMALLDRAVVYPPGWPSPTGSDVSYSSSAGAMLYNLLVTAQSRGALSMISFDNWTTTDSDGNAWSDTEVLSFHAGTDYLTIAKQLMAFGVMDLYMNPSNLHLYAYKSRGTDKSSSVVFLGGRHFADDQLHNKKHYSAIKSRVLVEGANSGGLPVFREVTGSDETDPGIGRREGYVAFSSSSDITTLGKVGQATIASTEVDAEPLQVPLLSDDLPGGFQPYTDYDCGDTVALDIPGAFSESAQRVMSMTIAQRSNGTSYTLLLDLNSIYIEALLRLAAKLGALGGGSSSTSSSSSSSLSAPNTTSPCVDCGPSVYPNGGGGGSSQGGGTTGSPGTCLTDPFDLFRRTVVGGSGTSEALGTATDGHTWLQGTYTDPDINISVDGYKAVITSGATASSALADLYIGASGSWSGSPPSFSLIGAFSYTSSNAPGANPGTPNYLAFELDHGTIGIEFEPAYTSGSGKWVQWDPSATRVAYGFLASGSYLFRWDYQNGDTNSKVRVWPIGAAEPGTWLGSVDASTDSGWDRFSLNYQASEQGDSGTWNVAYLVFGAYEVTDGFFRSTSPGAYGLCDAGHPTTLASGTNCSGTGQVTDGRGEMTFTTPTSGVWSVPKVTYAHDGPWGGQSHWIMLTDFILTSDDTAVEGGVGFQVANTSDIYTYYVTVDFAGQDIFDASGASAPLSLAYGTTYHFRWEMDYTGGYSYAKVWADGDPEPAGYQILGDLGSFDKDTASDLYYYPTNNSIDVGLPASKTWTASFGPIIFLEPVSCPPPSSGMLVPLQQVGTGDGSTTTFSTTSAYVSGTLRVLVDNLDETDAIASADPATGSFTLSFAPAAASGSTPAEVVYASWTAA